MASTTWCRPFWNIPKKSLGKQLPIVGWDPGFGRGSHFSHPVYPGTQESAGQIQFSSLCWLQPFSGAPKLPPTLTVWVKESLCFSKPRTFWGYSKRRAFLQYAHATEHLSCCELGARALGDWIRCCCVSGSWSSFPSPSLLLTARHPGKRANTVSHGLSPQIFITLSAVRGS